jgi:hypothetical protein
MTQSTLKRLQCQLRNGLIHGHKPAIGSLKIDFAEVEKVSLGILFGRLAN